MNKIFRAERGCDRVLSCCSRQATSGSTSNIGGRIPLLTDGIFTLSNLQAARAIDDKVGAYKQSLQTAPARAEAIREELAACAAAPVAPDY